jgi:hypothetical protein
MITEKMRKNGKQIKLAHGRKHQAKQIDNQPIVTDPL